MCMCVDYGNGGRHEWVLGAHGIIILHNVLSYPETRSKRIIACLGFPGGANGKNLPANAGDLEDMGSIPGFRKILWRRAW